VTLELALDLFLVTWRMSISHLDSRIAINVRKSSVNGIARVIVANTMIAIQPPSVRLCMCNEEPPLGTSWAEYNALSTQATKRDAAVDKSMV